MQNITNESRPQDIAHTAVSGQIEYPIHHVKKMSNLPLEIVYILIKYSGNTINCICVNKNWKNAFDKFYMHGDFPGFINSQDSLFKYLNRCNKTLSTEITAYYINEYILPNVFDYLELCVLLEIIPVSVEQLKSPGLLDLLLKNIFTVGTKTKISRWVAYFHSDYFINNISDSILDISIDTDTQAICANNIELFKVLYQFDKSIIYANCALDYNTPEILAIVSTMSKLPQDSLNELLKKACDTRNLRLIQEVMKFPGIYEVNKINRIKNLFITDKFSNDIMSFVEVLHTPGSMHYNEELLTLLHTSVIHDNLEVFKFAYKTKSGVKSTTLNKIIDTCVKCNSSGVLTYLLKEKSGIPASKMAMLACSLLTSHLPECFQTVVTNLTPEGMDILIKRLNEFADVHAIICNPGIVETIYMIYPDYVPDINTVHYFAINFDKKILTMLLKNMPPGKIRIPPGVRHSVAIDMLDSR